MVGEFLDFIGSLEFLKIFATALVVFVLQVLSRFLVRLRVFAASAEAAESEKQSARFECLRMGLDLSYLGLVTFFAVSGLALARSNPVDFPGLETLGFIFGFVQFGLVVSAILTMGIYDSPMTTFKRGIWIPNLIGWTSVSVSAALLYFVISKGL